MTRDKRQGSSREISQTGGCEKGQMLTEFDEPLDGLTFLLYLNLLSMLRSPESHLSQKSAPTCYSSHCQPPKSSPTTDQLHHTCCNEKVQRKEEGCGMLSGSEHLHTTTSGFQISILVFRKFHSAHAEEFGRSYREIKDCVLPHLSPAQDDI